jgi:hypothetical protein
MLQLGGRAKIGFCEAIETSVTRFTNVPVMGFVNRKGIQQKNDNW